MKYNYFYSIQILALIILFDNTISAQNWISTDLTSNDAYAISDIASHDGDLYATYSTGLSGEFRKSEDDGENWTTPSATNVLGFKVLIASAGSSLYLSSNHNFDSYLYYSTDGGDTFTQDTNGLPSGIFGGVLIINSLQVLDNKLVVGMGGSGYYYKPLDSPATPFVKFDTSTLLNAGTDKLCFYNGNLFTYDNSGAFTFYKSSNFGTSWSTPSATGLPSDLSSEILEVNPTNGRIYLSGTSSSGTVYGLYYTDDAGENWTAMDLSMVSATNYLGDFHKVTALYVSDDLFYAALNNDVDESYPDVITSSALSTTSPTTDAIGLPDDAPGNVNGIKFLIHNNKVTLALNIIDVYIKSQSLSVNDFSISDKIQVYPTIVKDYLNIKSDEVLDFSIYNLQGTLITSEKVIQDSQQINVDYLSSGIYFIKININNEIFVKKFIKR